MSEGNNVMRDLGYSGETQLDSNVPHYALQAASPIPKGFIGRTVCSAEKTLLNFKRASPLPLEKTQGFGLWGNVE